MMLQDSIPDFLKTATIESTLGALNELYSKYKYMETSFEKSKSVYKSKLPEITQSIELIEQMKSKQEKDEELITQFNLSDTVYAKAKVDIFTYLHMCDTRLTNIFIYVWCI